MKKGSKRAFWTYEQMEQIEQRYAKLGPRALAVEMGVSENALKQKAFAMGIKRKGAIWSDEAVAAIKARYSNEGPQLLAKEFAVKPATITMKANEFGLRLNYEGEYRRQAYDKSGERRRNNYDTLDVTYFDQWSAGMAYILGYTWADGGVSTRSSKSGRVYHQVNYQCVTDDEEILRFIKAELKSSAKITRKAERTDSRGSVSRPQSHFSISCSRIGKQLIEQYGIEPAKCKKDLPFIPVPLEFLGHFARGNFDGDGCIAVRKDGRQVRVGFLGTPRWLETFAVILVTSLGLTPRKPTQKDQCELLHEISWYCRGDIEKLYRFLYPTPDCFALKRKRDKFEQYLGVQP